MHTKDTFVNTCRGWQNIKDQSKLFPDLRPILAIKSSSALLIEAIHSINLLTLMISPQHEKVVWMLDFECQHQAYGFKALLSSINVVTNKEVLVSVAWKSNDVKKSKQVIKLSMNIAKYFDGCLQIKEHGLCREYLG